MERFGKREKLKSRKWIGEIFANGRSSKAFPLLAVYTFFDAVDESSLKVGFSVSKRKVKRAVDRNHIKRKMREAFRQNRVSLEMESLPGKTMAIMFLYLGHDSIPYAAIETAFQKLMSRLNNVQSETM